MKRQTKENGIERERTKRHTHTHRERERKRKNVSREIENERGKKGGERGKY